jgi:hypothetical protein
MMVYTSPLHVKNNLNSKSYVAYYMQFVEENSYGTK